MICDEDPLRRRPRESTARRKRQERCVWMARKMTEWPSKRGPITKIMPSDGCIGDTVPLAVGKWYDFHEFGWYMGNVGLGLHRTTIAVPAFLRPTGHRYTIGWTMGPRHSRQRCHSLKALVADDVARCVAAGVDLETRAEYGATSLHYAAAVSELPSVIAALVAAGADLEARDEFGRTPLHLAAKDSETPSVIATLVDAGTCRSRPARNNRWSCSAPMPAN